MNIKKLGVEINWNNENPTSICLKILVWKRHNLSINLTPRVWIEISSIVVSNFISYISGIALNYIDSFLIAKMLPESIRSKYDKLILWQQLMNWYRWIWAQYWPLDWLPKPKFSIQRFSIVLSLFQINIPNGSRNLNDKRIYYDVIQTEENVKNDLIQFKSRWYWYNLGW